MRAAARCAAVDGDRDHRDRRRPGDQRHPPVAADPRQHVGNRQQHRKDLADEQAVGIDRRAEADARRGPLSNRRRHDRLHDRDAGRHDDRRCEQDREIGREAAQRGADRDQQQAADQRRSSRPAARPAASPPARRSRTAQAGCWRAGPPRSRSSRSRRGSSPAPAARRGSSIAGRCRRARAASAPRAGRGARSVVRWASGRRRRRIIADAAAACATAWLFVRDDAKKASAGAGFDCPGRPKPDARYQAISSWPQPAPASPGSWHRTARTASRRPCARRSACRPRRGRARTTAFR